MRMSEQILSFRPPRIAILLVIAATLLHWLLPQYNLPTFSFLAVVTGMSGFAIMMRAWWLFKLNDTAICPTSDASVLIRHDVYSLSRNPMYSGIILMLFAGALYVGTLPFYLATVTYFLIVDTVFCPFEEQKLQQTFGKNFEDYQREVRRWIFLRSASTRMP